jgi:hypothetical protein
MEANLANEMVEIEGVLFGIFGKSAKFQGDFWDEPQFVPLSQCEWDPLPDAEESGKCTMRIAAWLVKKNGWE